MELSLHKISANSGFSSEDSSQNYKSQSRKSLKCRKNAQKLYKINYVQSGSPE